VAGLSVMLDPNSSDDEGGSGKEAPGEEGNLADA
jgi:hypothetical protein